MASTDFLLLYQELGLAPHCSIDELKRAYRLRISELHPDRQHRASNGVNPGLAAERLQNLTRLYGAATDFHRRHGRLPGVAAAVRRPSNVWVKPSATERPPRLPADRRAAAAALCIGISIALLLLLYSELDSQPPPPGNHPISAETADATNPSLQQTATAAGTAQAGEAIARLRLGMHVDDVLAIEAEPVTRSDDRWDYGPSWIAFDRGKVSDWYSSPLQPLKYASKHPPPAQQQTPLNGEVSY